MSKCNKLNCPMQYNKVSDDCDIKDCPYRTTDKIEDWETASKFLAMIFRISEEQRKEGVEKVKRDYDSVKEIEKERMRTDEKQIEEMVRVMNECCNRYDEQGNHIGNKCYECEEWSDDNHCCCSYNTKEATALYNAGYRKQEWISVEDRLPEESVDVLVVVKIGDRISVDTDRIYVGGWWFNYGKFGHLQGYVTHWMPLPEPPKMKGEGELK